MKKFFVVLFTITTLMMFGAMVKAQDDGVGSSQGSDSGVGSRQTNELSITNPLGAETPQALIGQIINSVLGVVGSLALLMFVYGGIVWMTSSGNQEKVKKGRDVIVWAAIGLVIVFSAYGLTRVLIEGISR